MKFTLVMCTLNRVAEVRRCLMSLDAQTCRDFELIVVDQSGDDRYVSTLAEFAGRFPLKHLRSAPGAARARNVGSAEMAGEVLSYPDDDCTYPPDYLESVLRLLNDHPECSGVCTAVADSDFWDTREGYVTRRRIFWQGLDFSTFLRKRVMDDVGGMDETLGPGAGTPWGSCEATDLVLRAMEKGHKLWYEPKLQVGHPGPIQQDASLQKNLKKARSYAMGKGHLLRMHRYPLWFVGYMVARPAGGMVLSFLRGRLSDARMYSVYATGTMMGYLS